MHVVRSQPFMSTHICLLVSSYLDAQKQHQLSLSVTTARAADFAVLGGKRVVLYYRLSNFFNDACQALDLRHAGAGMVTAAKRGESEEGSALRLQFLRGER